MSVFNFIFDIDGTISKNGKPVDSDIVSAILSLQQNGYNIIFASARPVRDILPMLPDELHGNLMIGCNGGMAQENGNMIYVNSFSKYDVNQVISFLHDKTIPYVLDGAWKYSLSKSPHEFHNYIRSLTHNEVSESELISDGVSKILVLNNDCSKEIYNILEAHEIEASINLHRNEDVLDITPMLNSKYIALQRLNIDLDKSVAFGNDANDYEMLRHTKLSVFVGNNIHFKDADYYTDIENIPNLICSIEHLL